MIKARVIKGFTLKEFSKLKNIQRADKDEKGKLFINDTFECDKEMATYLTGNNKNNDIVIKIIEVIPDETNKKKVAKKKNKKD